MKKLINISGELKDPKSTANKLSVLAAKEGKNLTKYIQELLDDYVNVTQNLL